MKKILVGLGIFIIGVIYGVYMHTLVNGLCVFQWFTHDGAFMQTNIYCGYPGAKMLFTDYDNDANAPIGFAGYTNWQHITYTWRILGWELEDILPLSR